MRAASTIVWFRQDLRLEDNPALAAAVRRGGPVLPVFVAPPDASEGWPLGSNSRWWQEQSLTALDAELCGRGSRLIVKKAPVLASLRDLVTQTGADALYFNRCYDHQSITEETKAAGALAELGVKVESYNANLLFEPGEVTKADGIPYQVFSAFWRRALSRGKLQEPLRAPGGWTSPPDWPQSDAIADGGNRTIAGKALSRHWTPGAARAGALLDRFVREGLSGYATQRDRPDLLGTSTLSPHLHFGEIGPRQVWQRLQLQVPDSEGAEAAAGSSSFLRELGWREFAYHLLAHFPHTTDRPLRPEFDQFPWRYQPQELRAWGEGRTGYPLVDAGMRQLAGQGWIHNRVRMVVASFLTKHLLLPWQEGAGWFWEYLVDADLANNTLGWQWVSGCGADAAPYFRIFNPTAQGEKFDPEGGYVRRWVPELSHLPDRWLHQPWAAPPEVLRDAGVILGRDYPTPIVDHSLARQRALEAYYSIRKDSPLTGSGRKVTGRNGKSR